MKIIDSDLFFDSSIKMENDWQKRFRERYYLLKLTEGLTQKMLADQIGVSQLTTGHWLRGKTAPDSIDLYNNLSKAIKLHPAKLLFDIDPVPDTFAGLLFDMAQLDQGRIALIEQLIDHLKGTTAYTDKRRIPDRRQGPRRTS